MSAREAEALRRFAEQSGVDTSVLTREDVVPLAQLWARSNVCARMDRTLTGMIDDAPERYEPASVRVALFLMTSVFVCLAIVCVGVWRFLA